MIDNNSTDGSVIAFTDSDCALEQGWLRSITAGMNNSKVGVQLGQTMPANNSKLFVLFETYQHYLREYIFNSKIQELYFGYTNNMTVRSSLLDKEMPFIEKQRGADSIIVSQLVDKHSCDIVKYCPEMRVRHLEITGMAEEYRNTDASRGHLYRGIPQDLFSLIDHLVLFFCISPFLEYIDLGDHVKRNRQTKRPGRRRFAALAPGAGLGFQIIHSYLAFGSGGLLGAGLGNSKQKLFYLPESHTDFILSIAGEELGFVGIACVVLLFGMVVVRGFQISLKAKDLYGSYLALGLTCLLALQGLINMGVVMGLLPTKGLTLPLISYGGSSLVITLLSVGVLLNIAAER